MYNVKLSIIKIFFNYASEKFMNDSNIPYTYSKNNKFVNLMKGSIDQ